ncbi:hypothetical protein GH714_028171 [Hevea brasiliensis]|uniref:Fe2OG dioxygenase domain-containing protein n=1 Tax=Hevea brasiliensis TaxID=3981 RepID=A0A6A6MLL4_HEVBR|nr:hypothetical protein GH714_028171 [Hevea brasiliensis]
MLGSTSLLVPSVKEIVKEQIVAIPPRYVCRDHDNSPVAKTNSLPQMPVIDLGKLFSQEFEDLELEKLDQACKEWGFFQLVNHGVSTELLEKVKLETQEFFNLQWKRRQNFGKNQEKWKDLDSTLDALEAYSELQKIAKKIFNLVAKAVGMKPDEMRDLTEEGWQAMRMNYYPPCPEPDLVIGLRPHSDATGLTIVLQLNEVEGLQIHKDGMWIPVKPIPNAFIINIGDMLEIVTNGIYRSIEHRATISSTKERLSIATFHNPKFDGELCAAPSLITPETPPVFKSISVADYFKGYLSRELHGKSFIDVLRIPNHQAKSN